MSTTTNWCTVSRKVNTIECKSTMTMEIRISQLFWFSCCGRLSNVLVHGLHIFSPAHGVLQKSFMSSCCWTYSKPLRLIGTTVCVCRTNKGQPKVTRHFGTVLSTAPKTEATDIWPVRLSQKELYSYKTII